jgi:hypothetical protein
MFFLSFHNEIRLIVCFMIRVHWSDEGAHLASRKMGYVLDTVVSNLLEFEARGM